MIKLPIPENETARLQALYDYELLDSLPEEQFDRLTKLASYICESPIALISLVDKDRQWFKSKVGLDVNETQREISFCQYTILGQDFFEVEDTLKDFRFNKNPLVMENPKIRFYAAYPLLDPNGFALGSLCIIDQIPKKLSFYQREALKTLSEDIMLQIVSNKKNEERKKLEKFFLMSLDMICIANSDGYFKKINPSFLQTLGWTEEQLLKKSFIEFVHPDDVEKTILEIKKLSKGVTTLDFITRFRTIDNSFRLLQWVANSDSETGELFAIARDITLIKKIKAENEASASTIEQLNTALNESAIVSITDSHGKIEFVNEAFCKVLKFTQNELIGKDHQIINSGFHSKNFFDEMWATIIDGKIWKGQMKNLCKDGSFCWLETTIVPFLDINKKPFRYVAIRYDVTERVQLEEALRKSKDEIEKTVKIKEQFLANMSHEIRTPLNAIIGFSEILRSSKLTPKQEEHALVITKSGENLMCIINDILDFTKIESGNVILEKVPINIRDILDNVKKMLQKNAYEKHIDIKILSDNDLPNCVFGDPVRLNQILLNLVGNSIKFTSNGYINISCSVRSKINNDFIIEFVIKDTGIGIPPDKIDLIFERFVQAEDDTTRKFGGTGLGLSIVKNIVKLMEGEIFVESELGNGSQFTFVIPAKECTISHAEELISDQSIPSKIDIIKLCKLNILLVEDNRMNQLYVSAIMHPIGIECTIASDGNEAIKILSEKMFDIILMDIQMPLMDGYQVTNIIRNELKINTPIIALTANATTVDNEKCLKSGMNDYVSKPYKPDDLLNKISEILFGKMNDFPSKSENNLDKSAKNENKLIHIKYILEQVNGKMNVVKQLIDIFNAETLLEVLALEDSILKSDFKSIESISHSLVSTFSILGIESAIKILKRIELNARNEREIIIISELFIPLFEITTRAKTELNELSNSQFNPIPLSGIS